MSAHQRELQQNAARLALRPTLKPGDEVHLNNEGLETCFGSTLGVTALKSVVHTITYVDSESMTYPEATFVVEVADPELNQFLLNDSCFDLVQE